MPSGNWSTSLPNDRTEELILEFIYRADQALGSPIVRMYRDDTQEIKLMMSRTGEDPSMPEPIVTINAAPHSVEISRNANGGVSFSSKTYGATPEEALKSSKDLFAMLDAEYPVQIKEKETTRQF